LAIDEATAVLVLFDIDGTLLLTDGAGRAAIRSALEAVYGTSGPMEGYDFHGKTDPQIVLELMAGAGLSGTEIRERLPEVWPLYLEALEGELEVRRVEGRLMVLPGVVELLSALDAREEVSLGLLTGNIEEGARLKLRAAGVRWLFDVGAYGSDSEVRSEIARIAVGRGRLVPARGGSPAATVVIGDTPEDVACARAVRARAVAVATGRHGALELEQAGADVVFDDFRDTAAVLESILSLSGGAGASSDGEGR
jgi:phosphoglycolate phosphatase-like HAD superfamily hydrolase